MRCHRLAGRDARRHLGQLQGRRQHVALADSGHQRIARPPVVADRRLLPPLVGNDAGIFAGDVDAGARAQAQAARHLGDALDSQFLRKLVIKDIAGLANASRHIDGTVPPALPAMELAFAEIDIALAVRREAGAEPGLQRRHQDRNLEGRPRGVLPGDGLVGLRPVGVVANLFPVGDADPIGEQVGVVAGRGHQRQDLARVNLHDGHGGRVLVDQPVRDESLQSHIQGHYDIVARFRLDPPVIDFLNLASEIVDHEFLGSHLAAQGLLELVFDTGLADAVGRQLQRRVAVLRHFVLVDRADITHHMRRHIALRVKTSQFLFDGNAGKVGRIDFDAAYLFPGQFLADRHRQKSAPALLYLAQHPLTLFRRNHNDARQRIQCRLDIAGQIGPQVELVVQRVDCQRLAVPVDDIAAGRRQQANIDAVVLGHQAIAVAFQHLQRIKTPAQPGQQQQLAAGQQRGPAGKDIGSAFFGHFGINP